MFGSAKETSPESCWDRMFLAVHKELIHKRIPCCRSHSKKGGVCPIVMGRTWQKAPGKKKCSGRFTRQEEFSGIHPKAPLAQHWDPTWMVLQASMEGSPTWHENSCIFYFWAKAAGINMWNFHIPSSHRFLEPWRSHNEQIHIQCKSINNFYKYAN